MEENKVTISLKEYLKLRDNSLEGSVKIRMFIDYLFKGLECNSKGKIEYDKYNLDNTIMRTYLQEIFPDQYDIMSKILKNENEEE